MTIPEPPRVPQNATPELRRLWLTQLKVKMALANHAELKGDNSPASIRMFFVRMFCKHDASNRRTLAMPDTGIAVICGNCGLIREHSDAMPRTTRPHPGPPVRNPPPFDLNRKLTDQEVETIREEFRRRYHRTSDFVFGPIVPISHLPLFMVSVDPSVGPPERESTLSAKFDSGPLTDEHGAVAGEEPKP